MRLAWTMALGVLGLALAIGAIWLTDWLVDMLPRYARDLPPDVGRTLSVLRYPAAFVVVTLGLSLLAPFVDRLLSWRRK
ncbi:MAG: hypothetical protein AAF416_05680 [Pseudomonadota bacterium]